MKGMKTGQGVVLVALDVNDNSAKMNAARWGRGCLQAACTARWALGGAASNARACCHLRRSAVAEVPWQKNERCRAACRRPGRLLSSHHCAPSVH